MSKIVLQAAARGRGTAPKPHGGLKNTWTFHFHDLKVSLIMRWVQYAECVHGVGHACNTISMRLQNLPKSCRSARVSISWAEGKPASNKTVETKETSLFICADGEESALKWEGDAGICTCSMTMKQNLAKSPCTKSPAKPACNSRSVRVSVQCPRSGVVGTTTIDLKQYLSHDVRPIGVLKVPLSSGADSSGHGLPMLIGMTVRCHVPESSKENVPSEKDVPALSTKSPRPSSRRSRRRSLRVQGSLDLRRTEIRQVTTLRNYRMI